MKLIFFKDVYREPFKDDLSRILLEGVYENPESKHSLDFYIYVWIEKLQKLKSFQAVLADNMVMLFRIPGYLTVGNIKREPVNRAVSGRQSDEEERMLRNALQEMEHECFQAMLDRIKELSKGVFNGGYTLTENETAVLKECFNQ